MGETVLRPGFKVGWCELINACDYFALKLEPFADRHKYGEVKV